METHLALHEYLITDEDDNHHPRSILDIAHITFPKLQEIYLYNNNIESIEVLCSVRMPSLTMLIFGTRRFIQPTTA